VGPITYNITKDIRNIYIIQQYDEFDSESFIDYLKQIQKRFGKCIIFVDRARPHRSKITRKYLDVNKDTIRVKYFPLDLQNLMQLKNAGDRISKYHIFSTYYHCLIF